MPKAEIIYWYAGEQMRADGGGLRIAAWEKALTTLGYDCMVVPLWTIGGGVSRGSRLSKIKRSILPMPLSRRIPEASGEADLVVATVPAAFADAVRRIGSDRLILDWMDLWSVASRNMGDAHPTSVLGGRLQSELWKRREKRLVHRARINIFAGYDDLTAMSEYASGDTSAWVPTPVSRPPVTDSRRRTLERVGFIGNLDYPPNAMSLRAFLERFSNRLDEAGLTVVVAGYGSNSVSDWGFPVHVLGEVSDVHEFYEQIDAAIVPIEHGGGVKVKALEAASRGVPVFGTDHVRAGLSPQFRHFIRPLEDLLNSAGAEIGPVADDLFWSKFSQEAFTNSIAGLVGTRKE